MSTLEGDECSASRPSRFIPGEGSPVTTGKGAYWIPRSAWTQWRKKKIPFLPPPGMN